MKNLFLIILCLLKVYASNAQVIDSLKSAKIIEFDKKDSLRIKQLKNKSINYIINHESQKEYFIRRTEQFKTKAIIIDHSERQQADIIPRDTTELILTKKFRGPSQFDSRIEVRDLDPSLEQELAMLSNASSVGIIIEKEMMHKITDSIFQLDISSTLGSLYNLCPNEPFRSQPVIGVGTTFIINEQNMITAAHVFTRPIENYAVVFGYEILNKVGVYEAFIPLKNIYYPTAITYTSDEMDVTAFKVDRILEGNALRWSPSRNLKPRTPVYMEGHPMGLPKKIAFNASITGNKHPLFFHTTLDAFQGNSGSPVFRLDTHELIGVLVSGELDYKWNGNCNTSTLCSVPYCLGEKVIRIEHIMNELEEK